MDRNGNRSTEAITEINLLLLLCLCQNAVLTTYNGDKAPLKIAAQIRRSRCAQFVQRGFFLLRLPKNAAASYLATVL